MKYFLFLIISLLVLFFIGGAYYDSSIGSNGSRNSKTSENFDNTYDISYSDKLCSKYGYSFKLLHQRDGHSNTNKMHKSNCKINNEGDYEGYIFPKANSKLRIFWVNEGGIVAYRD